MDYDLKINRAYEYSNRIRKMALDMALYSGKSGSHVGGSFSCIEIFATLYGAVMNLDISNPTADYNDRFIPSKAHCAQTYYSALVCIGLLKEEDVCSYYDNGGMLAGKPLIPEMGLEYSGGSLGLGLSVGLGKALHARRKGLGYNVYVLLGDGESNEGSVWEAIMAAAQFKMDNLIAIVDYNNMQFDGANEDIMGIGDIKAKFEAFGWMAMEVDGHSIEELYDAFLSNHEGKPLAIIAHTIKARGIPSLENQAQSHHAVLSQEDYDFVLREMETGKYDRVQ